MGADGGRGEVEGAAVEVAASGGVAAYEAFRNSRRCACPDGVSVCSSVGVVTYMQIAGGRQAGVVINVRYIRVIYCGYLHVYRSKRGE